MSKKNDAAYESFLADLKTINPAVEEILKDEKVSAKLRESVLARSEFSSQMDALKSERETFNAEVTEAQKRIAGWQDWYGKTAAELAAEKAEIDKLKQAYGEVAVNDIQNAKNYLTADQLQKELQQRDVANLKFATDLVKINNDHFRRFKEELDMDAVYKVAAEKQVPLDAAYNFHIADKVAAKNKAEFDDAIKAAREEGAKEALSKHNLFPAVSSTSDYVGPHAANANQEVSRDAESRVANAVAAFMKR